MRQWHETYRVPASITLTDGSVIEGEIHLQKVTALHGSGEAPVDMLNRPERFFAVSLPSGGVTLVCKAQVVVLTCDASLWEVDGERQAISKEFRLDVEVVGGRRFNGSTSWELPPTHPRPQDFLNVEEAFFEIIEDGVSHCINRTMVAQVRPSE